MTFHCGGIGEVNGSQELSERLEELEQQRATHVQNVAQRDKTINGLVGALHGKENEVSLT